MCQCKSGPHTADPGTPTQGRYPQKQHPVKVSLLVLMPWLIGVILKSSNKNTPGILVLDLESHAVLSAVLQLQLTLHHLVKVVRTFKVEANCRILSWTKHIIQVRKLWVLTQGSHRLSNYSINIIIIILLEATYQEVRPQLCIQKEARYKRSSCKLVWKKKRK